MTRLRAEPAGGIRVVERPADVPPDQLVKLRTYKDELAPIIEAYGEVSVVIRPAAPLPPAPVWPPRPTVPRRWQDLNGWRALLGYARTLDHRLWVVSRWAQTAGGEVQGRALHLPPGLLRCLALADLKTQARIVGLKVPA